MISLEIFQAFVAPAIFISAASLLVLSINTRLMGIVTRLRIFHKEKHLAIAEGKKKEALVLQSQIESIQYRALKIKNAFFCILLGITGTMVTCLIIGLALYIEQALVVGVLVFVVSILLMLVGLIFYISEVSISLSSEKEEEILYALIDVISEQKDCDPSNDLP